MAKVKKVKKEDNKLTLSDIKKASLMKDETDIYILREGDYKGKEIEYYPSFSQIKIEQLGLDFVALLEEAEDNKLEISEQMNIYLIELLIIKHFTHFKKQMPDTLLGESNKKAGLLDYLDHFRKTGLFGECFDNMFSANEVHKVFDRMADQASHGLIANQIDEAITKKFKDLKLKNADVLSQMGVIDETDVVE